MQATDLAPQPEDLYTINAGGLQRHRRRLRPRPRLLRALVPLHGRLPDGGQGHLGIPAQAAAGPRPHHQGRGRDGALGRLSSGASSPARPWGRGRRRSPGCRSPAAGTPWSTRRWPSSAPTTTTSCCWPGARRRRRRSTTGSSTGGARCRCTAPGRSGCGSGDSRRRRSSPSSPWGSPPTAAIPNGESLRDDLSEAVASGRLTLPEEEVGWIGH